MGSAGRVPSRYSRSLETPSASSSPVAATANPPKWNRSQSSGSHLGLGFNGIVLAIVADRLAQPEGAWQPFQPKGLLARVWRATAGRGEPGLPSAA